MSIKKELLERLTEQQLKKLADHKGLKFTLSDEKKKYYDGWDEKSKLVDLMTDYQGLSITEIEHFILKKNQ